MQWNDKAIVLSIRRLGENSGVAHLLTAERGLHAGVDKGAFGRRRQGTYQPGNIVQAHWQARLSEHVGTLTSELVDPVASRLLDSRIKLAALTSATQMVEKILPERDPHPEIYARMLRMLMALSAEEQAQWLKAYVQLEYALLECAGFGLDLERCAATGQNHDLHYVSPKTGRAVSRDAGKPYHDRMLALPPFLLDEDAQHHNDNHLLEGIRLCGYFLNERVFTARGAALPAARLRLVALLPVMEEVA